MVSIPQAVWIACNSTREAAEQAIAEVSIPQAVWIACNGNEGRWRRLHKVSIPQAVWIACNFSPRWRTPFFFSFQYRKRYGLHAIPVRPTVLSALRCFNTASGMDCMQFTPDEGVELQDGQVSIPQAVWIACNASPAEVP